MKTKNFAKKALVMVAMMFMFVMDSNAQQKRMMESIWTAVSAFPRVNLAIWL